MLHIVTSWRIRLNHSCAAAMGGPSKNSWTHRDAVQRADSSVLNEQCISWVITLAPPGKCDWTFSCTSLKASARTDPTQRACNSAYPFIRCLHTRLSHQIFPIIPSDAAFHQNSLTTRYTTASFLFYSYPAAQDTKTVQATLLKRTLASSP